MIKLFDQFEYSRFSEDDIISVIKNGDFIYVKNIKNLPDHEEENPVRPLDIDDDGLITIEVDGKDYEVNLKNVIKLNENFRLLENGSEYLEIIKDLTSDLSDEYDVYISEESKNQFLVKINLDYNPDIKSTRDIDKLLICQEKNYEILKRIAEINNRIKDHDAKCSVNIGANINISITFGASELNPISKNGNVIIIDYDQISELCNKMNLNLLDIADDRYNEGIDFKFEADEDGYIPEKKLQEFAIKIIKILKSKPNARVHHLEYNIDIHSVVIYYKSGSTIRII